ncbi:hypothetical protein STEG23_027355, partial [Scotinomys teguina]
MEERLVVKATYLTQSEKSNQERSSSSLTDTDVYIINQQVLYKWLLNTFIRMHNIPATFAQYTSHSIGLLILTKVTQSEERRAVVDHGSTEQELGESGEENQISGQNARKMAWLTHGGPQEVDIGPCRTYMIHSEPWCTAALSDISCQRSIQQDRQLKLEDPRRDRVRSRDCVQEHSHTPLWTDLWNCKGYFLGICIAKAQGHIGVGKSQEGDRNAVVEYVHQKGGLKDKGQKSSFLSDREPFQLLLK